MIAYRIQDKSRGVEYLLDSETQYSWPMNHDESLVRRGVSGCETIEELAAYWTTHSSEAWDPVLVCVEGPQSEDTPLDELAEHLKADLSVMYCGNLSNPSSYADQTTTRQRIHFINGFIDRFKRTITQREEEQ